MQHFYIDEQLDKQAAFLTLLRECHDKITQFKFQIPEEYDEQIFNKGQDLFKYIVKTINGSLYRKDSQRINPNFIENNEQILFVLLFYSTNPHILLSSIKDDYFSQIKFESFLKQLLLDEDFQNIICDIMDSKVMKDYYSAKPILKLEKNEIVQIEKTEMNETIIKAYQNFLKHIKEKEKRKSFFDETFSILELPFFVKGYTNRFLKIVINSHGIKIENVNKNLEKVSFLYFKYFLAY